MLFHHFEYLYIFQNAYTNRLNHWNQRPNAMSMLETFTDQFGTFFFVLSQLDWSIVSDFWPLNFSRNLFWHLTTEDIAFTPFHDFFNLTGTCCESIWQLPPDLQQQVLRLPADLTGKLVSRIAARALRRLFLWYWSDFSVLLRKSFKKKKMLKGLPVILKFIYRRKS